MDVLVHVCTSWLFEKWKISFNPLSDLEHELCNRDGPLEKLWGEEVRNGIFVPQEFFLVI